MMHTKRIQEKLEKIRSRVLHVTGVDVIKEKRRFQEIVYAKKIFCNVARQKNATFHQIGNFMKCNHATVISHTKDFDFLCKYDEEIKKDYLRVIGVPIDGKLSRDMFDLTIGMM